VRNNCYQQDQRCVVQLLDDMLHKAGDIQVI